jgi:hypothetical protein
MLLLGMAKLLLMDTQMSEPVLTAKMRTALIWVNRIGRVNHHLRATPDQNALRALCAIGLLRFDEASDDYLITRAGRLRVRSLQQSDGITP